MLPKKKGEKVDGLTHFTDEIFHLRPPAAGGRTLAEESISLGQGQTCGFEATIFVLDGGLLLLFAEILGSLKVATAAPRLANGCEVTGHPSIQSAPISEECEKRGTQLRNV